MCEPNIFQPGQLQSKEHSHSHRNSMKEGAGVEVVYKAFCRYAVTAAMLKQPKEHEGNQLKWTGIKISESVRTSVT